MPALPEFELARPRSAAEAVALKAQHPKGRFLAGGTDLLPNLRRGLVRTGFLIDLGGIEGLDAVADAPDGLWLGAGVTLETLATHPLVAKRHPALAQAAAAVAGPTHRFAATLGGNLCLDTRCRFYNQSEDWREANGYCMKLGSDICRVAPKSSRCFAAFSGDVAPALMVLQAEAEVLGPSGARRLPVAELYRDDGLAGLALQPDELLVRVRVPLEGGWRSGYEKVRIRGAVDFPLVGVAFALKVENGLLADFRGALTGVSCRPEPVALEGLVGRPLDEDSLGLLEQQVRKATKAMETTLAGVPYRRRVGPVLARRLALQLFSSARG